MTLNLSPFIAHRGTRVLAPENTMSAFTLAHQHGATWLECDLQLSKDGEIVIFHDEDLARTSNGVGLLSEWGSEHLSKLDVGNWFKSSFAGERMPTLEQLLLFAKISNMGLNLELKPTEAATEMLVMKVIEALVMNPIAPERLLISSFAIPALTLFRHYDPNANIGALYRRWDKHWYQTALCLRSCAVICDHRILSLKRVQAIHDAGFLALAYTVNRVRRFMRLRSWGVDAIFADDPRMLSKIG